jgi:hypothetical protein
MDKEVPVCKTGGFNGRLVQLEDGSVQLCRDKCNGVCPFPQPRPPYVTYIPWFSKYNAKRRFKTKNSGIAFNPGPTAIVDIISPVTGRTWMDRNLGAWQAASGPTDALAYGDLYQYGRRKDGHENRISETSNTQATSNLVPSPNTGWITHPNVLPGQHRIQQQVDFTGFNKTTALFRMTLNGREIVEDVLINGVSAGFDLTMLGFGNLDQLYTVNNSLFNNNVNTLEFLYRNVTQTTFTAKIHFSISVTPL